MAQDGSADPISWKAALPDTPIQGFDGAAVGSLAELLGSGDEDIFHGIVVKLTTGGRHVFVPADEVEEITASYLRIGLTAKALGALPTYDEKATFHVGMVGTFRKHAAWIRDDQG